MTGELWDAVCSTPHGSLNFARGNSNLLLSRCLEAPHGDRSQLANLIFLSERRSRSWSFPRLRTEQVMRHMTWASTTRNSSTRHYQQVYAHSMGYESVSRLHFCTMKYRFSEFHQARIFERPDNSAGNP